jgi:hypothetical protein
MLDSYLFEIDILFQLDVYIIHNIFLTKKNIVYLPAYKARF